MADCSGGLYVARADGTSPTLLLPGPGRVTAVLPDGRVVLQVVSSPGVQVIDPARPDDRPRVGSALGVIHPDGSGLVVLGEPSPLRQTFGVYLP